MAERSKRIEVYDVDKLSKINEETMKLFRKYKMDMELTNKKLSDLRGEIILKAAGNIEEEITKEWLKAVQILL